MAFSPTLSRNSFPSLSPFPQTLRRNPLHVSPIRAVKAAAEPEKEKLKQAKTTQESSSNAQPSSSSTATGTIKPPKKPVYSSEYQLPFKSVENEISA